MLHISNELLSSLFGQVRTDRQKATHMSLLRKVHRWLKNGVNNSSKITSEINVEGQVKESDQLLISREQ